MAENGLTFAFITTRDLPEVLGIEKNSFEFPWSEEDFVSCLQKKNTIGKTIVYEAEIIGFVIYQIEEDKCLILKIAVHFNFRKMGFGRATINDIVKRRRGWKRGIVFVVETDRDTAPFFEKCNFKEKIIMEC